MTVDLGSLGSRESLDPKLRTKDWDATGIDKNDLLELEEINFMNKKSVRVRRTANQKGGKRKSGKQSPAKFIMVSNQTTNTPKRISNTLTIEDPELANKYVLDKGDGLEQFNYSGTWGSAKHVKKLPASFLKMKLQRDLRQ